jgi:hypothetical protein
MFQMEFSDDSQSEIDATSDTFIAMVQSVSSEMSSGIETVLSDLNLMSEDIIGHRSWVRDMIANGERHISTADGVYERFL